MLLNSYIKHRSVVLIQYLLNMSKILTVFGATGNQGGSVIEAVLADSILSKEFKIRGITRDASKPAAQALAAKGVEVVTVSLAVCPTCFPKYRSDLL